MKPRRAIPPLPVANLRNSGLPVRATGRTLTRYGVAPIGNRLFRGVALRKRAELLQRNEETENSLG